MKTDIKTDSEVLLQVEDLKKHFPIQAGVFRRVVNHVKAVDGVSFEGASRPLWARPTAGAT
jgi:ABC-type microcin C transport system duplicated ATPase subunit YejF